MISKRVYLLALILFSSLVSGNLLPGLADDPILQPGDSVRWDWNSTEPMHDPDWPQSYPCDGINHFDDKYDDVWLNGPADVVWGIGPWVPSMSKVVTRIELIFHNKTQNIALGIWSDDGGGPSQPSTALAYTEYFMTSAEAGWQGADLIKPLPVLGGEKYWFVIHVVNPTGIIGGVWNPSPPYIGNTFYSSITGDITGDTTWSPVLADEVGIKVRVFCEKPISVGGSLLPLNINFNMLKWGSIPILALIIITIYTKYNKKIELMRK